MGPSKAGRPKQGQAALAMILPGQVGPQLRSRNTFSNDSTRPGGAPILGQGMAHMILPGPMGPEIGRALSDPYDSIRPDGPPNLGHPKCLPQPVYGVGPACLCLISFFKII